MIKKWEKGSVKIYNRLYELYEPCNCREEITKDVLITG